MDSTRNVRMSLPTDNKKVNGAKNKTNSSAKYNFRTKSIQNRIEVEQRKSEPRHPKPKQRPAPLSKYRRRTANLRERCRMQEMNDAFKRLQSVVPDVSPIEDLSDSSTSVSQTKLSKINTLKLAVNYISALTQMLTQPDNGTQNHLGLNLKVSNENAMCFAATVDGNNSARSKSAYVASYPKHDLKTATEPIVNQVYNKSIANFYSNNCSAAMANNDFEIDSSKISFYKAAPKCSPMATELVPMSSYEYQAGPVSSPVNRNHCTRIYENYDYGTPLPSFSLTNSLQQVINNCTPAISHSSTANDNLANILDDFDTFIGTFDNDDSNLAFGELIN